MKTAYLAALLLLEYFVQILSQLVSLPPYPGKHDSRCNTITAMTGAIVKDKIFVFGGCYNIPHVYNVTDEIYSYNVVTEEWIMEGKTPWPLKSASLQVVNDDIYLYNIRWNSTERTSIGLWAYNTKNGAWKSHGDFPFLWHGALVSCEHDGKLYFGGSDDGFQRNILQVYDLSTESWKSAIYLSDRLVLRALICRHQSIQLIAGRLGDIDEDELRQRHRGHSGPQSVANLHRNGTLGYPPVLIRAYTRGQISNADPSDPNLYMLIQSGNHISISYLNLDTFEEKPVGSILSNVQMPLLMVHGKAVYLLGGVKSRRSRNIDPFGKQNSDEDATALEEEENIFHHKFIVNEAVVPTNLTLHRQGVQWDNGRFEK
ncbi:hypothetical protein BZG36_05106 [Bifiguratus adelaidae]|uniref:Uncharacterized protein n=1 Tax=Bifiguratus adelaidae TaxID=1938954 RepID=A0A261XWJ5_9FUNG|nr:hypothetical protein BZG36_05106 [Bifiguratus adelaidae]